MREAKKIVFATGLFLGLGIVQFPHGAEASCSLSACAGDCGTAAPSNATNWTTDKDLAQAATYTDFFFTYEGTLSPSQFQAGMAAAKSILSARGDGPRGPGSVTVGIFDTVSKSFISPEALGRAAK